MSLLSRYVPLGLLSILLWVLVRGRAYRSCPWFFAYVSFGVVAGVARLMARLSILLNPRVYPGTYWITEAGYDVLGMLVMYEVLRMVFGNVTRAWWARLVFPIVLVFGFCMSIVRSHDVPPALHGALSYIVLAETAVRFVQVTVFASLVTLVPILGLRWRQYPFGVATGFGVYATVMLVTTTQFSDFGTRFKFLWSVTSLVAYSLAVLIWIWFFSAPQKAETPSPELSAPSPGDLKQYKDAIRRMR